MGIWFLAHNSVNFCPIWIKIHIRVSETTSYIISVLGILGDYAYAGQELTNYGRGCIAGTGGRLGSGTPLKVWSLVLCPSLSINCYGCLSLFLQKYDDFFSAIIWLVSKIS